MDPAYAHGSLFLRSIGITNVAEISRVLDISMNANSMFLSYEGKRTYNKTVRHPQICSQLLCG